MKYHLFTMSILFLVFSFLNLKGQSNLMLSQKEAQQDLQWLRKALELVHPRLYKYQDKQTMDASFDKAYNSIKKEISGLDLLNKVSKINASVNCGHLYTIPQFELREEILEKKVVPFFVKVIEDKLYLFNDCSLKDPIPSGSEIVALNGMSAKEILTIMMEGIATDGFIETRKKRLIERYIFNTIHGFDLYYHLHIDHSSTFEITYLEPEKSTPKTKKLEGITMDEREELLLKKYGLVQYEWFDIPSPQFNIIKEKDYAILSLPRSFYDEKIDPNFDSTIHAAFHSLKTNNISNLILDLRNNEGGSEHHQMLLMSYLYDQPFKLYQNIYLSNLDFRPLKPIVIERDTVDLLFNNDDEYMRKIGNNLWINNYQYSKNLQLQPPQENVFNGNLYVLINGITFSSSADLASDIRKTTNAVFIGEESGGTFEGPTGGASIVVQLPNSKIMVRISPNIQMGYMYKKHPIGRGVIPDYPIQYSVQDYLKGRDLEMEKAISLIKE